LSVLAHNQSFWKYIKSLRSNSNKIPATVFLDNDKLNTIEETLHLFVTYFSSVFVDTNSNADYSDFDVPNDSNLNINSWNISEVEILEMLDSLHAHSGVSPDGIPHLVFEIL